jgi:hypothetical protein
LLRICLPPCCCGPDPPPPPRCSYQNNLDPSCRYRALMRLG